MNDAEQNALRRAIHRLMLSDNFGDVHEVVDTLRELAGLPPLEGDYLEGWTKGDYQGTE